jgi:PAS domain S-box-containing protein
MIPNRPPTDEERELREVLDSLPVLVSYIDRNLRYVRINRTYEEWFKRPRQEAVGKTMPELLGQDAYLALKPYVDQALQGRRVTFEASIPYASGTRWILATYLPRKTEGGETKGFIALVSDITDRKVHEGAQREALEQFRTLAALAPVGIFRSDAQGDCTYVNDRWLRYAGFPIEQALGKGWAAALHPEDRDRVSAEWSEAMNGKRDFVSEYRFRTPQGHVTWLECRASALRNPDGSVAGYIGTVTDITEHRYAQDRQRFLADASDLLGSSIDFETTLENVAKMAVPRLADWSAVYIRLPGEAGRPLCVFSADPEKERLVEELLENYPFRPELRQGMGLVLQTGRSAFHPDITETFLKNAAIDEEHLRRLKELGLRSSIAVPILVRGEVLGAISFASSSQRRRFSPDDLALAEELARRAAMAIDNARHYREARDAVRAREEFLSIASHELKTPLTTLLLQLQALRRTAGRENGPLKAEDVTGPVDLAIVKGQQLADMINELLDVSSLIAGRLRLDLTEGVDVAASARFVVDKIRTQESARDTPLRLESPAELTGSWDPIRLEQVLTNLVMNAVRYGPGREVVVTIRKDGGQAIISVRDQGVGIAAEDHQRIFHPFERVRSDQFTGWGLGLHIVKQIVEAHRGTIELESAPGKGSTFTVRLPLAQS